MKFVSATIGIAAAGVAGYLLEPTLRPAIIPMKPKPAVVVDEEPPITAEFVESLPAWVSGLMPEQLPARVTLKREVAITVPDFPEPISLPAGARVTPIRVEGSLLVVSPFAGPLEGAIPITVTDLMAQLGPTPPPVPVAPTPAPPPPKIAAEPEVPEPPVPAEMPPAEPEEKPAPEVAAAPTPEAVSTGPLAPRQIVELMQSAIKADALTEFTFDQVLTWEPGEDESRDGESFQTGNVVYKAETIFGVKNIQAQALIKDGKIVRWVWPKSGMEIK